MITIIKALVAIIDYFCIITHDLLNETVARLYFITQMLWDNTQNIRNYVWSILVMSKINKKAHWYQRKFEDLYHQKRIFYKFQIVVCTA